MIRKPFWPRPTPVGDNSPFVQSQDTRPLRLTIHAMSAPQSVDDADALVLLRSFARLDALDVIDTTPGTTCHVAPVQRTYPNIGTMWSYQFFDKAGTQTGTHLGTHNWWLDAIRAHWKAQPVPEAWQQDVFAAGAHKACEHDFLVTTSSELMAFVNEPAFRELNVCSPSEAAKIVGLFLRSKGCFAHTASDAAIELVDPWTFYILLARTKLPRLRNRSAASTPKAALIAEVNALKETVVTRCRRAIEARDQIGVQFYLRWDHRAAEVMCYHLDYLLMLLTGALDAMMLAVKCAFAIDMDDRRVGFWSKKFRKQLSSKAPGVLGLISTEPAEALRHLLAEPRNSIHALHLQTMGYKDNGGPAMVLVKMGDRIGNAVTQATSVAAHVKPRKSGPTSMRAAV